EGRVFALGVRDEFAGSAAQWKRDRLYRLLKCRKLVAELSPRTELLERWVDELADVADELSHLVNAYEEAGCPADRAKQERLLRDVVGPPGHHPRAARPRPHRARPLPPDRDARQDGAPAERTGRRDRPRADERRTGPRAGREGRGHAEPPHRRAAPRQPQRPH